MTPTSIESLHRGKSGKISDKWSSYLPYYDKLLAPLRDAPIRMLEIGVQNGGSLETWAQYFHQAELFVGCDIDPRCGQLRYEDARVKVVVGDACAAPAISQIVELSARYDLVIDDGSHKSDDILNAFINYFPLLSPGGIYVVEDACCLYMNDFDGGLLHERSAYAFFKRLVDVLSFEFWDAPVSINQYLRTFFDTRQTPAFIVDGWVDSIEFRNSVITIRKAEQPGHRKLGERVTVGTVAQVQDWGGTLPG